MVTEVILPVFMESTGLAVELHFGKIVDKFYDWTWLGFSATPLCANDSSKGMK